MYIIFSPSPLSLRFSWNENVALSLTQTDAVIEIEAAEDFSLQTLHKTVGIWPQ